MLRHNHKLQWQKVALPSWSDWRNSSMAKMASRGQWGRQGWLVRKVKREKWDCLVFQAKMVCQVNVACLVNKALLVRVANVAKLDCLVSLAHPESVAHQVNLALLANPALLVHPDHLALTGWLERQVALGRKANMDCQVNAVNKACLEFQDQKVSKACVVKKVKLDRLGSKVIKAYQVFLVNEVPLVRKVSVVLQECLANCRM
jgi:hypothetical protein